MPPSLVSPTEPRPMLATSGDLPSGPEWTFEVKHDGIRILVATGADPDQQVRVRTRHGTDLTRQFPEVVAAAARLPAWTVLDGELVVHGEDGRPVFSEVRRRMALQRPHLIASAPPATIEVFDVPITAGEETLEWPIEWRREALTDLQLQHALRQVTVHDDGIALFEAVGELGLEGVVAKRSGSPYRPAARSRDWVKTKHHRTTAMQVVAGRRRDGRLEAVLVAHADGEPVAWLDDFAGVSRHDLEEGLPPGEGEVWGEGPLIAIRHLLTPGLREARIIAARPRR